MTSKQSAFVQEYMKDRNAKAAALRAGYAETTAHSKASLWVGKSRSDGPRGYGGGWDAVRAAESAAAEEAGVEVQDVIEGFLREARGQGPDTSSAARTAAWDKLAKHLGFYEVHTRQRAPFDPSAFSRDELQRIAGGESPAAVIAARGSQ